MDHQMNIRHLKYFMALVEYGSYARASEAVHLSQPALSRSIQQLEEELGVQLFERGRLGAQLSVFGRVALPHVRGVIAADEALRQSVESIGGLESGHLDIGAGPYPSLGLLDRVSARFIDRYPGIHLRINNSNWRVLHKALLGQELEFFVADVSELVSNPSLSIEVLPRQSGTVFCRTQHPLTKKLRLEWQDLLNYPMALPKLPEHMESYLHAVSMPFGGMKRRLECDNFAFLTSVVAGSDALGLAPKAMLLDMTSAGLLVSLNVDGMEELSTGFGIVQLKGRKLSPAAEIYRAMVLEEVSH
jgi:DNA-binding transcriptional LysR family regulator